MTGAGGLLLLGLLSALLLGGAVRPGTGFWAAGDPKVIASALLDRMSDEQVLGQVFMLAYPGDTPPELMFRWIRERGLGGVKIFGWNAESSDKAAAAIAELQKAALASPGGIPLLVATDEEGGWIRHVKGDTSFTPGNMAIGASGRPYDAYRSGLFIGRELAALGVNMNFAPVVDLATRPRSEIIGPRAFCVNPMEAAVLGSAFAKGLGDAGVIATAKHFPGHGDTDLDSHLALPVIRIDEKTLWNRELVPYRMLVGEGIPAIMSGHLCFPLVSGSTDPASLSRFFLTDLLRKRLGFKGLVVTDDLFMGGAAPTLPDGVARWTVSDACLKAMEAGDDMLMMSRLLDFDDPAWTKLLAAYRANPEFRARVREAATIVLLTKLRYLKSWGPEALVPDLATLHARVPAPGAAEYFRHEAFRSATALDPSRLPFRPAGRILVAGPFPEFAQAALAVYPGARSFGFSFFPESAARPAELAAFDRAAAGCDTVLICVANQAGMDFAERAHLEGKKVGIISVQSPAPLERVPWASAAVAVYGFSPESLKAGLAVLTGAEPSEGRMPILFHR
ncbi:MAG: glycoside hydrolase family 3 protein [Treponema sp.]|nr:glycoside hydrolase family 3 protein [Treponema sp.]